MNLWQQRENDAASAMDGGDRWFLPLREGQFREFEAAGFGSFERRDEVLVSCVPPRDWTIRQHPTLYVVDPRHRLICDGAGKVRGKIFLKTLPHHEYYGFVTLACGE